MQRQVISWIVFLIMIIPASSYSQNPINVEGKVVNNEGQPEVRAQVRFEGPSTYLSLTNSQGKYAIEGIKKGTYNVTVQRSSRYQEFTVIVKDDLDPKILIVNW